MDSRVPEYISLDCLAARLRLPKASLRKLAQAGAIPALKTGRWWRFEEVAVRAALRDIAQRPARQEYRPRRGTILERQQ